MITSLNLCAIPFLGHCDNTRLQMAAKQLSQAITNPSCEVPKVIGENYSYLSNSSNLFKLVSQYPGTIVYLNEEIMIVLYETQYGPLIDTFDVPQIRNCSSLYATKLRYKRGLGPFNVGDILYEYDCFHQGIPTYGYNLWTAYMSFFGYNHEDSMIFSESAAQKCKATKNEVILLPIYTHSLYNMNIYSGEFGFIPEIGNCVDKQTVSYRSQLKSGKNIIQQLNMMNITSFTAAIDNNISFNTHEVTTRIKNGRVTDLRIHRIGTNNNKRILIDKKLQIAVNKLCLAYGSKLNDIVTDWEDLLTNDHKKLLLSQHYILQKTVDLSDFDKKELAYLIEIQISGEDDTCIGDKHANRYANKGVISLIIPNELRPYSIHSGQYIDSIVGPISVVSRMNFGQTIEGLISKGISKAENEILKDPSKCSYYLESMAKTSDSLGNVEYSNQIRQFILNLTNPDIKNQLIHSIQEIGLYFEAPNFANFNLTNLINTVENNFDVQIVEPIRISKKLIKYMNDKLKINMPVPSDDFILPNIYVAPIYTIKLKQLAKTRSVARDFGNYKMTNRQPSQGRNKDGVIAQGSRLGQMEFDGILGHSAMQTMKELRTIKNDCQSLKMDMASQILTHNSYNMPQSNTSTSYTKLMIDSLISFLNS